jgi:hypothetical protein
MNEPTSSGVESVEDRADGEEDVLTGNMIRIVGFDETEPKYANDVFVAADPGALHFIFTRFVPPPIVTEADEQRIAERGFVPNHVVGHIVVPSYVAEKLLQVLPGRLDYQRGSQEQHSGQVGQESAEEEDDT